MLIIFDLDDTLIDTSGSITPIKLEHALDRMIEAGFALADRNEALEFLKRLDQTSESSAQTLAEFVEVHEGDSKFLEIGIQEIYGDLPDDIFIYPLEGAQEVLSDLKEAHQLALVTMGKQNQQLKKMEKAGLDSTIFSKIAVCEKGTKKEFYKAIVEELGYDPSDVVVCGDRIGKDLSPAKELGFKTVQMRSGRGLNSFGLKSDVDFVISSLEEIKDIITNLMSFSSSEL